MSQLSKLQKHQYRDTKPAEILLGDHPCIRYGLPEQIQLEKGTEIPINTHTQKYLVKPHRGIEQLFILVSLGKGATICRNVHSRCITNVTSGHRCASVGRLENNRAWLFSAAWPNTQGMGYLADNKDELQSHIDNIWEIQALNPDLPALNCESLLAVCFILGTSVGGTGTK